MLHWKTAASATAISFIVTGSAAFADVTAQQVWDDWKSYMTGFGYDMSSNESTSGDTLTVSDVTMSMNIPEEDVAISVKMGEFTFTNNGDGTVAIDVPSSMPVAVSVDPEYGGGVDINLDYDTTGYSLVVSGDPNDMTYNYSVAAAKIGLKNVVVEGQTVELGTASMAMENITGSTSMKVGNLRSTNQNLSTGPVTIAVDIADPEGGDGRLVFNGNYNSMSFSGGGDFPINMDMNDVAGMLAAGFSFDGEFTGGGGTSNFNFQEHGDVVQASSSSTGGSLKVAMDATKLHYGGSASGVEVQMSGGDIPLPVQMAMAEFGFNLLVPIAKSDTEQDFALAINMGGFTISDLLWSIADPGSNLPHDPATIALDLAGKAKLFFNMMDPEQMAAVEMGQMLPGELNTLDLNSLTVSAAGAALTGNGAFTFDNSDLTTFDGLPAPTGSIDLKLEGGNGLLDKLIAMGLVPEEEAMGMRMMMGLFAVPGDGEDTLTSKIEVSGDGQIKANGQRLK